MAGGGDDPDSSAAIVTIASSPPPSTHPSNDCEENNPAGGVLTLALPIQHHPPPSKSPFPAPAARVGPPIREDCWSEGATSALIDAWGERYLHLNRGILRRNDWQEVADAVSSREDYTKPPKTDSQCKNRIDTLKKKYKQETSKRSNSGTKWIFYDRLHHLTGGNPNPAPPKPISNRIRLPAKRQPQPPAKYPTLPPSEDESSEGFPPSPPPPPITSMAQQKKRRKGAEIGEIMRAVMRFAEMYEKAEKDKMVAEAEVEKRRLEFEKEIEVQRAQFFIRAQMEIDRIGSGGGRRREHGGRFRRRRGNISTSNNSNDEMSEYSNR